MIIEAVLGILVILVLGFIIYKQNGHEPATIAVSNALQSALVE